MAVIEVNPGDSIQAAIDEANANDTILVNPGTYTEPIQVQGPSLIRIDKPLTVRSSEGPEVTILNGASAEERYYAVDIASSDVTLEGFTIKNPDFIGSADASGIVTSVTGDFPFSNITVRENIITEIGSPERMNVDFGSFGINAGPVNNLRLSGNRIFDIGHIDPAGWAIGIFVYGNDALNLAENVTIEDNRVYDIRTPGPVSEAITVGGDTKDFFVRGNRVEAPDEQAAKLSAVSEPFRL
ncbi:right-handed parallel beta-helix repeat-containing protein [Bacillus sp. P14.5]|uniref:right-handed parallel beta-helix repeat-containing protein n=1 Tax=Bacillus sp. P14.5 TaxID=1983400 RepID=UPI000DEBB865|nr:right-handed parallel beta-helix repeat-containing protein [Bacillus sp. P14.5]